MVTIPPRPNWPAEATTTLLVLVGSKLGVGTLPGTRGSLRVGQQAPDLELPLLDEGSVRLSELWRERPVFLVFGSCT
jgi:hypothetical protein